MGCKCRPYVIVIPWLRGILLIYTPKAQGPQARGLRVYMSAKSQAAMVLGRTHVIGERTNENSSHLFYTVASEDQLWF